MTITMTMRTTAQRPLQIALPAGFDPLPVTPDMTEHGVRLNGRVTAGDPPVPLVLVVGLAPLASAEQPALMIATSLVRPYQQRHPHAQVGVLMLANGPALVACHAGEYRLPAALTGTREEVVFPQVRSEIQVPDLDRLVIVSVAAAPGHGPAVLAEATRLAGTVGRPDH